MASFNDLPAEVAEYLFLHVSPYGELQNCMLVSHSWCNNARRSLQRKRELFKRCRNFECALLQVTTNKCLPSITERCSHSSCYLDHTRSMYVFGGCTAAYTTFNDLWRFDAAMRTWSRLVPMGAYPSPKACASMLEYKGRLVLFGGWSKSSPNPIHQTAMFFNELHVYDAETNMWTQMLARSAMEAPHLAGHSATIIDDWMVVFGGSRGSGSSNIVWVFDFKTCSWSQPAFAETAAKPLPRYGQSQILIDRDHLVIAGGCGGPNLIFNDVWLLRINRGREWTWSELTVENPECAAPQLWSHPGCSIGDKFLVLSKPAHGFHGPTRYASRHNMLPRRSSLDVPRDNLAVAPPPQAQAPSSLRPPRRRLLISSRSLDEDQHPDDRKKDGAAGGSSKAGSSKGPGELQRASSIPAIIVGEIPTLVVTEDNKEEEASTSSALEEPSTSSAVTITASSLLPHHATVLAATPQPTVAAAAAAPPPQRLQRNSIFPSVKPNATCNRERQLELLRRMEQYIRSKGDSRSCRSNKTSQSAGMSNTPPPFRPSSPPPRQADDTPSTAIPQHHLSSRNPMHLYELNLSRALSHGVVSWSSDSACADVPDDTILYSLVRGRCELIVFGGMRSAGAGEGVAHAANLDVTPFIHKMTNETFILRPHITLR